MENMDLSNAEVAVTTQHILDGKEYKDYWVQMSDYSDMGEFLCACSDLFPEEAEPEYRYPKWENIPERLINREWICPNFFEIRDALERLDEDEKEYFVTWSEHFGYDITTDDPHMMVSHYQDIYGNSCYPCGDAQGNVSAQDLCDAVEAAKKQRVAVVVVGLPDSFESEAFDRDYMRLPEGHISDFFDLFLLGM